MKLTVSERFALLGILPHEGDFITLKIIRQLREDLSFDEDEAKGLQLQMENDKAYWDVSAEPEGGKEIEIGEIASTLISETLKKLDKEKKLTEHHISLYEKFVTS
jgi:hypothetical protein